MNEDLDRERQRATFNVQELTTFLYEGQQNYETAKRLERLVLSDPVYDNSNAYFLSHEEAYEDSLKKELHFLQTRKDINLDQYPAHIQHKISNLAVQLSPLSLHRSMFTSIIQGQGNEEQLAKWLPLIKNYGIIGTYAQTEMGHGTFVRGLETTATYNPKTQCFILNSPTLTATKWWPGSLGHTVTHAAVFARLITLGKDYGIHAFIVQLRSLEDHTVLPGRKLGSIGPKMGYIGYDNGYLRFDHVQIPRENMLMKYAQVSPDGHYSRTKGSEKLTYISMVGVRAVLAYHAAVVLGQACTISIRYSAVRRQSKLNESEPELQILDYKTQQYFLLPALATSYAFWFTALEMNRMYSQVLKEIGEGNLSNSQELHATSAGVKAFATQVTAAAVETCRYRCGGHGYSLSSGLPTLYTNHAAPACTYEGENIVMMLQTARYLMKYCSKLASNTPITTTITSYLFDDIEGVKFPATSLHDLKNPNVLVLAFRHRAARLVKLAYKKLQTKISSGLAAHVAWNAVSIDLMKAAQAHCHLYIVENFAKIIMGTKFSLELHSVMKALFNLYAIHGIVENSGDFLEDQYMNGQQMNLVKDLLAELLGEIRVNAVGLVDAFDFSDHVLKSVLGRYDGNVYEHLMKWAEKSPLNRKEVLPAYGKYLRPLMKGELQAKL